LFIQGVGVHGDGWTPQTDDLAREFTCLSFDNRGMGRSQPLGVSLSVEQMADDARRLLDAEGWDAAHVVGHSLGGLVAQCLALTVRERVRSLSLLCTFARGKSAAPLTPSMLWLGMRTRIGTRRMRQRAFLRLVMPPSALDGADTDRLAAELEPLFGHDIAYPAPVTMRQLSAMRKYDATPRLSELKGIPTLVVSAAHDPIAPPSVGKLLAEGIPGTRYVEVPETSHGVPIHQPGRINALLREHIRSAK
jgi:pimeloyl-ACP methyl ester carboxylesterase